MKKYLPHNLVAAGVAALILFVGAGVSFSLSGVYTQTKHGNSSSGVYYTNSLPKGSCGQCHSEHNASAQAYDFSLFASNDNNLCWSGGCHNQGGVESYQGRMSISTPHTSASLVWPGAAAQSPSPPARPFADGGKCVNCHTPHGYKAPHPNSSAPSESQLIPNMTVAWEEVLCLACHRSGGPATDIRTQITKTYAHPTNSTAHAKRHASTEGRSSGNDYKWRYGYYTPLHSPLENMRHAECQDCHNPHAAANSTHIPGTTSPNPASGVLRGASGVAVNNGSPWTTPTYTWINFDSSGQHPQGYVGVGYEYQICFKCHSSWTTQPTAASLGGTYAGYRQTDQSVEFNPNNSSFHWVENHIGASKASPDSAYVNGFSYNSKMYCSDCHKDDAGTTPRGPHGSGTARLLGVQTGGGSYKTWNSSVSYKNNANTIFCFNCHSFRYSNFREKTSETKEWDNLHLDEHDEFPCQSCHVAVPHGWKRPRLLVYINDEQPYRTTAWPDKGIFSWTPPPYSSDKYYDEKSCGTAGGCH